MDGIINHHKTRGLFRLLLVLRILVFGLNRTRAQIAPALFVFGDSIVDVGNNNYLPKSKARCNYPHNGIDFPNHEPTGRFSNGKNMADLLAEKLGLPFPQPYLSMVDKKSRNFLSGVSFASGGAGIFDDSHIIFGDSITLNKQIEHFRVVKEEMVQQLGQEDTEKILSKAIIAVVIGSNDFLGYFDLQSTQYKDSPLDYVESAVIAIKSQLQRIYDIGGRKFVMIGVGVIGCCPSHRNWDKAGECNEDANLLASKYNQRILSILQQHTEKLKDFHYSYIDSYSIFLKLILQPASYGFNEVKLPCCGKQLPTSTETGCEPVSSYCSNRSDHIFWDFYHPTELVSRIHMDTVFNGSLQHVFPINIRQLTSL